MSAFHVKGKSWFDREFSLGASADNQEGWDCFSLQFDTNEEIMLSILRNEDGSDRFSSRTPGSADGKYRHLAKDDFMNSVTYV